MMTVGLTGNVASGKTTVADRWRESGVTVIDADRLGHAVLEEDAEAREALVREFGGGILGPDGRIDRSALGEAAFSAPGRIASLNAIVHPPLLERLDRELEQARESGAELAVVDAALVFEFGLGEVLDAIVLVTAPAFTGGSGPMGVRAGAAAAGAMKEGQGPVSRAQGRFTVITDGEILTNNSEDGAAAHPAGKQVHWDVSSTSSKIPETLIRLQ